MVENLSLKKINSICNFQKRFRFLRNEIKSLNLKIIFYKDVVMSMLNNLNYLNNLKIFENTDSHYLVIINEIKKIKDLIDYFPEKLKFKDLKEKNLLNYQIQSLKINNEIY